MPGSALKSPMMMRLAEGGRRRRAAESWSRASRKKSVESSALFDGGSKVTRKNCARKRERLGTRLNCVRHQTNNDDDTKNRNSDVS